MISQKNILKEFTSPASMQRGNSKMPTIKSIPSSLQIKSIEKTNRPAVIVVNNIAMAAINCQKIKRMSILMRRNMKKIVLIGSFMINQIGPS
jgi:hypothetical protein